MPPVGFKPTLSAGERPQTHAFHRAATGTGKINLVYIKSEHIRSSYSHFTSMQLVILIIVYLRVYLHNYLRNGDHWSYFLLITGRPPFFL